MALWNLVLSGYPSSGKTVLARRLVSESEYFARLSADDMRGMLFDEPIPSRDEGLVYSAIVSMRDLILKDGRSVVIDTTAPNNRTREVLLNTKVRGVNPLLIVVVARREILIERNREKGYLDAVEVWDRYWEDPLVTFPTFKFRSNNMEEFETNYYILRELLGSRIHPFRKRFVSSFFPKVA